MAERERVTVVGGGVIGLTSAHVLAEAGYDVDIVARDLPSDSTSQAFASPWAGANFHPFDGNDDRQCRWESTTFKKIWDMIPSGIAMKLVGRDYYSEKRPAPWFKDLCPDFKELETSEIPPSSNMVSGIEYSTWSVNAPEYIKWLQARLETLGVPITRASLVSIEEPFLKSFCDKSPPTVVVNCTALGAQSLVGVEDELVHPIRGQTVLVWAPHFKKTISILTGKDLPPTYIIPRPNGEVILGGTFLVDDWNLAPDAATTRRIVEKCHSLEPSLSYNNSGPESIPIIKVNVGLRPARRGGARLERETISVPLKPRDFVPKGSNVTAEMKPKEVSVVHAYGNSGAGYQASWGMAEDVLALVQEHFKK